MFSDGGAVGGLVFGIPLIQCVENDRLSRLSSRGGDVGSASDEPAPIARHGSRTSFNSLFDAPRGEEVSISILIYANKMELPTGLLTFRYLLF